MKNLRNTIVLLTLMLLSNILSAQYQSIFGSSQSSWYFNSWLVTTESVHCLPDSAWVEYNQDTIFNGKVFKPHNSIGRFHSSPFNDGFVSEDTTTGEAWYRYTYDTTLYKFMDMSLTLNDSFYLDRGLGGFMVAVDSVYYHNGKKHIKLGYQEEIASGPPFTTTMVDYIMIEGVGINLFGVSYSIGSSALLKRKWTDSLLNYSPIIDSVFYCDTLTSLFERSRQVVAFDVFPNPVQESANISLNELNAEKLELIDLSGRLVKSFSAKEKVLNFSDVRNGVYFIRLITTNQDQFTQKVVVQK